MTKELIQNLIWQYLQASAKGQDAAITAETIGSSFCLEVRTVRKIIRELRLSGCPIASSVSDPKGYYIPTTTAERMAYAEQLEKRMKSMAIAYHCATQNMPGKAKEFFDQLKLNMGVAS